jgi:2-polyprenyl-3-methyl-5-hydroxy-6-metoxy-1,4-benzoquinol methylase
MPDAASDRAATVLANVLYRFADAHWVETLQRHYVPWFTDIGAQTVLDIGCGRGLFLELLRNAGINAVGVDSNAAAVEQCRARGFGRAETSDAKDFLRNCVRRGERFDGVFCSHIIEHMDGRDGVELVSLAAQVLNPGGRFVVVTPNTRNLEVATENFWMDPTHVRPYPRRLLEALLQAAELRLVASFEDAATRRALGGWRGSARLLGDLAMLGTSRLRGYDSVVVAESAGYRAPVSYPDAAPIES